MTILACHQSLYFPYMGYFDLINQADIFVNYNTAQYTKNNFINRNRIKHDDKKEWLTVPIQNTNRFKQLIKDTEIDNTYNWSLQHKAKIEFYYRKSPYYKEYEFMFDDLLNYPWIKLDWLNMSIVSTLVHFLDINTEIVDSSDYDFKGNATEKLVAMCKEFEADTYITRNVYDYLDTKLFKQNGIELKIIPFKEKIYKQVYGEFIPKLSIIDVMCNTDIEKYFKDE